MRIPERATCHWQVAGAGSLKMAHRHFEGRTTRGCVLLQILVQRRLVKPGSKALFSVRNEPTSEVQKRIHIELDGVVRHPALVERRIQYPDKGRIFGIKSTLVGTHCNQC